MSNWLDAVAPHGSADIKYMPYAEMDIYTSMMIKMQYRWILLKIVEHKHSKALPPSKRPCTVASDRICSPLRKSYP